MTLTKTYALSFGVLLASLFALAFLTSLGALLAYALAFASASATWLVAAGLERRRTSSRGYR